VAYPPLKKVDQKQREGAILKKKHPKERRNGKVRRRSAGL
jgi:hypothetical protein